ncbi:MAG: hypothetical protein KBC95_01520 [Candidatus Peribacteraceae bacterium]|nr:hypothetical protein [Candidatus Peribacteraceae bacterium]
MTIETSIARAIQRDLDIVEALPEIHDIPVEQVETFVEGYVLQMHERLSAIINQQGKNYLKSHDAAGLCATCLDGGVSLPPRMMLKMCQTIIELSELQAKFILDTDDGKTLYYFKMTVDIA